VEPHLRDVRPRQRGQVVIIVALMAVLLFGLAAFAFDLSLAMSDRRMLQTQVDSAVLAGAASFSTSANAAHWVTMQYLQKPLSFTLPTGSCISSSACPAGTYAIGTYTVTIADPTSSQMDLSLQHREPGIFASLFGAGIISSGSSARAIAPGPSVIGAPYAAEAVTGDISVNGGGTSSPSGNVGGPVYAYANFGANNGPHASKVPGVQTNYDGTTCPGSPTNHVDLGGSSNGLQYLWVGGSGVQNTNVAASLPYETSGPTPPTGGPFTTSAAAKDVLGNWKPGTYSGIAPNGGMMNAGVYKIVNYGGTISPGTNVIAAPAGTEDALGAVAIVLDSTDTGSLDLSAATLNGLDDLHVAGYVGPRDLQGTHNFVFWSTNGANGYGGSITVGSTDVSGITYLPKAALSSRGNQSWTFTGASFLASASVSGGGNGTQEFLWVCGLGAVVGSPSIQPGINR
jgi:hypothetical protein